MNSNFPEVLNLASGTNNHAWGTVNRSLFFFFWLLIQCSHDYDIMRAALDHLLVQRLCSGNYGAPIRDFRSTEL